MFMGGEERVEFLYSRQHQRIMLWLLVPPRDFLLNECDWSLWSRYIVWCPGRIPLLPEILPNPEPIPSASVQKEGKGFDHNLIPLLLFLLLGSPASLRLSQSPQHCFLLSLCYHWWWLGFKLSLVLYECVPPPLSSSDLGLPLPLPWSSRKLHLRAWRGGGF